jgi:hypothetical protein
MAHGVENLLCKFGHNTTTLCALRYALCLEPVTSNRGQGTSNQGPVTRDQEPVTRSLKPENLLAKTMILNQNIRSSYQISLNFTVVFCPILSSSGVLNSKYETRRTH